MNFEFHNPARLIFGAGSLTPLGDVVREKGQRALLVTGGGSVERNGKLPSRPAMTEQDIVDVLRAELRIPGQGMR